jgi:hypothetical protein
MPSADRIAARHESKLPKHERGSDQYGEDASDLAVVARTIPPRLANAGVQRGEAVSVLIDRAPQGREVEVAPMIYFRVTLLDSHSFDTGDGSERLANEDFAIRATHAVDGELLRL